MINNIVKKGIYEIYINETGEILKTCNLRKVVLFLLKELKKIKRDEIKIRRIK